MIVFFEGLKHFTNDLFRHFAANPEFSQTLRSPPDEELLQLSKAARAEDIVVVMERVEVLELERFEDGGK